MNMRVNKRGLGTLLLFALLLPQGGMAAEWLPLTLSGSLGYNYRWLAASGGDRSISRAAQGSLFANSYIWRPWLATTDMGLTVALDNSDATSDSGSGYTKNDQSIVTGVWNLNMLPQSRTPFTLRYAASDTRTDTTSVDADALVLFAGGDSKARKLGIQQSLVAPAGHRLFMNYDNNRWYSERGGHYQDTLAQVQGELLSRKQRLALNTKLQESTRSTLAESNEATLVDLSHFFYPTQDFRVDTKVSASTIDRSFDVPSTNLQSGTASSDIQQFSSFLFWRPEMDRRWTVSGGFRNFDLSGENLGQSNESKNLSANAGAYYQYNNRLRFDGSAAYSTTDSNGITQDVTREHFGALYQSDLTQFRTMNYSWYGSGAFDNIDSTDSTEQLYTLSAGHQLQRLWAQQASSVWRLSFGQSLSEFFATEDSTNELRLENSVALSWNQNAGGGQSYLQTILSDRRNTGDGRNDQQLFTFQANRDQQITRRNSLSGNLTIQRIYYDFTGQSDDRGITTATGRIDFRSIALFGVPRLSFNSNWLYSRASYEDGVDRQEWGNRLDYTIGQLSTSLSHRYIEYDDARYQLVFFNVMRNF